jgi:hypothetical protein
LRSGETCCQSYDCRQEERVHTVASCHGLSPQELIALSLLDFMRAPEKVNREDAVLISLAIDLRQH